MVMLLEEEEEHLDQGRRLVFAPHREEHYAVVECFALSQVEPYALRYRGLADSGDSENRCESVVQHCRYYLLHLNLSANELGDLGNLKRVRGLLSYELVLTLAIGAQHTTRVLFLLHFLFLLADLIR